MRRATGIALTASDFGAQLPVAFFARPTLDIARGLLGKLFRRTDESGTRAGFIVEVEAYHESGDEASHSFRGMTKRNEVMFGRPGNLYVYFTYGMHFCMNIVTEAEGTGAAVLIRALEPVAGIDRMIEARGGTVALKDLTNGPAKCCQALGIDRSSNGKPLHGEEFSIHEGAAVPADRIRSSSRIGIRNSVELPWRFYVAENAFLSRNRGKQHLYQDI